MLQFGGNNTSQTSGLIWIILDMDRGKNIEQNNILLIILYKVGQK